MKWHINAKSIDGNLINNLLHGEFCILEESPDGKEVEVERVEIIDILENLGFEPVYKLGFEARYSLFHREVIVSDFVTDFSDADYDKFTKQLINDGYIPDCLKFGKEVFHDKGIVICGFCKQYIDFMDIRTLSDEDKEKFKKLI